MTGISQSRVALLDRLVVKGSSPLKKTKTSPLRALKVTWRAGNVRGVKQSLVRLKNWAPEGNENIFFGKHGT